MLKLKSSTGSLPQWIGSAWSWWTSELAAALPEPLLRLLFGGQHLAVEIAGDSVLLNRVASDRLELLARLPLGHQAEHLPELELAQGARSLVFCLPERLVLNRSLLLPQATEENLQEVLAFEMDRKTPFTVDQVYYDHIVESRDSNGMIQVRLVLAPRARIDALLEQLDGISLKPDRVTLRNDAGDACLPINLLPSQRRRRRMEAPRRLNRFLMMLLLLLLAVSVTLPIIEKRQRMERLSPQLQALKNEAVKAKKLRTQVDSALQESRFLVERKRTSFLVLELLNEFTRLLPDDTWISQFELDGGEVHIRGQSQASAVLIPLVESSPYLQHARFRSPVTQNRKTNTERFHLSADVRQEQSP